MWGYNLSMRIDILTLFPEMFAGVLDYSILRRAQDHSVVKINIHNLRDWATDKYKSVDDRPYGSGPGMVLRVDIIDKAVSTLKSQFSILNLKSNSNDQNSNIKTKIILLDAKGKTYKQKMVQELAKEEHLILICGHYEGVDQRVAEHIADEVISVGDYVLSGGEIPAMVIVDSIVRLLPGALGNPESLKEESFSDTGVEYAQYTRPEEYKGWKVPEVLLSGNHKQIKEWRNHK